MVVALGVVGILIPSTTFSQAENVQVVGDKELSGEVLSVDSVESVIVVKYLIDEKSEAYEAELFKVGPTTDISKVKVGDRVQLSYSQNSEGTKTLNSLRIEK